MKPILFNTEMVRAIKDGWKTVTRRVIKPQFCALLDGKTEEFVRIESDKSFRFLGVAKDHENIKTVLVPPCTEGEILYVRETWATTPDGQHYLYRADANPAAGGFIRDDDGKLYCPRWKPSIHMPKEVARIFLRVTDVKAERLQQITPEDCIKEGVEPHAMSVGDNFTLGFFSGIWDDTVKPSERELCDWDADPWVWVIRFEQISREEAQG